MVVVLLIQLASSCKFWIILTCICVLLLSCFSRLSSQDARKKKREHLGSRLSRKTPQKLHVADRVSDIRISAPISAPTTPYASPGLSPLKAGDILGHNYMAFPGAFQVCSAPEMPPSDTSQYSGFSYHVLPEKNAISVDNSPHHSPRASPQRSRKIASGPTSPLHQLLPNESSTARRESSAQGNVHPLPLPPLGATPLHPTSIPPVPPNAELTPIKGQWQKGKLIGRGTFGSVYVASNRYNFQIDLIAHEYVSPLVYTGKFLMSPSVLF